MYKEGSLGGILQCLLLFSLHILPPSLTLTHWFTYSPFLLRLFTEYILTQSLTQALPLFLIFSLAIHTPTHLQYMYPLTPTHYPFFPHSLTHSLTHTLTHSFTPPLSLSPFSRSNREEQAVTPKRTSWGFCRLVLLSESERWQLHGSTVSQLLCQIN